MTTFYFDGVECQQQADESILDSLIRLGHKVNYSCKRGVCKTCLVQRVEGETSVGSQRGLNRQLKRNNYINACLCRAKDGLKLKSVLAQDLFISSSIIQKRFLSERVAQIQLNLSEDINIKAGQFINLRRFDGLTRSYAITQQLSSREVIIEAKRHYNGQFSDWLFSNANIGTVLLVQGPLGDCCYLPEYTNDKLIVIAAGTGIGSAFGIIQEALAVGHKGDIALYFSACQQHELYHHKALLELSIKYRQLRYQAVVPKFLSKQAKQMNRVIVGELFETVLNDYPNIVNPQPPYSHRFFLCGEPKDINLAQQATFLAGFPLDRVHTVKFNYKELRQHPR